jgi:TetR/AcrR family transcriptional regulator, transcriptional repressor for nem operon
MSREAVTQPQPNVSRSRHVTKQETREALVAAGLAEFAERGLDAPSLDSICARAGFTRGAFYVHFRNRDEFLEAVMEQVFGALLDAVIATGDGARDVEETIGRFAGAAEAMAGTRKNEGLPALTMDIHRVLDACARSPVLRRRFVALMAESSTRVADAVAKGQVAGTVRADIEATTLGQILAVLAFGVLTAIDTGVPIPLDPARGAILRLLAPQLPLQS